MRCVFVYRAPGVTAVSPPVGRRWCKTVSRVAARADKKRAAAEAKAKAKRDKGFEPKRLEFVMEEGFGLEWDDALLVDDVTAGGQGESLGVQLEWRILRCATFVQRWRVWRVRIADLHHNG